MSEDSQDLKHWTLQEAVLAKLVGPCVRDLAAAREVAVATGQVEAELGRLGHATEGLPSRDWPTPIAVSLRALLREDTSWFMKVHRLIDATEVLIKYAATIAISDLIGGLRMSESFQTVLAKSLSRPMLGHWAGYLRTAMQELGQRETPPFVPELLDSWEGGFAGRLDRLLALRNSYAHGAVPDQGQCRRDYESSLPQFIVVIDRATFLIAYSLLAVAPDGPLIAEGCDIRPSGEAPPMPTVGKPGDVLLCSRDGSSHLCLSPILAYRPCQSRVEGGTICGRMKLVFYNDQTKKDSHISYIDYEFGHHGLDPLAFNEFEEKFPLQNWRGRGLVELVEQFVEERRASFIGRERELEEIRSWAAAQRSGYLMITAGPGLGKSSLLATVSGWKLPSTCVISSFIRRGTSDRPEVFLRAVLDTLARRFDLTLSVPPRAQEMYDELRRVLVLVATRLSSEQKKLLWVIDGLDEALSTADAETSEKSILDFVPTDRLPSGVLLLMAGRPWRQVNDFFLKLDRESSRCMELTGLSDSEVREMLYDVTNKYELTDQYAAAVVQHSQGNPLYLTLLSKDLLVGEAKLNDAVSLPKSLTAVYAGIWNRLVRHDRALVGDVLRTICLAREQLTASEIAEVNQVSREHAVAVLDYCNEILRSAPGLSWKRPGAADGREDAARGLVHTFFHDSVSDYIRTDAPDCDRTQEMERRLLRFSVLHGSDVEEADRLEKVLSRLLRDDSLFAAGDALSVSELVRRASRFLTGHYLVRAVMANKKLQDNIDFFAALARQADESTARVVEFILSHALLRYPDQVSCVVDSILGFRPPKGDAEAERGQVMAAVVAVNVVVAASEYAGLREFVLRNLSGACWHDNPSIRMFGIVGVHRVFGKDRKTGLLLMGRLSDAAVRLGVPRPQRIEPFAAAGAGLFFQNAGDTPLRKELHELYSQFLGRLPWLGLATRFLPPMIATFLSGLSDDYLPTNLLELKQTKEDLRRSPELSRVLLRVVDFVDPAYGKPGEFENLVLELEPLLISHLGWFHLLPVHTAIKARGIAGDMSALEAGYQLCWRHRSSTHVVGQDFAMQLRIVQLGRQILQQPELDPIWTERNTEEARNQYYSRKGSFICSKEYFCGALIPFFPYLRQATGDSEPPIMGEFIDHALQLRTTDPRIPGRKRSGEMDLILLRVCEVNGLVYGPSDHKARGFAFYSLRCFLRHCDKFDEDLWAGIANVVSRLRVYYPLEVSQFLEEAPKEIRQELEGRVHRLVPQERIDNLLSMQTERFEAAILGEPSGQVGGLRPRYQDFLRALASRNSVTGTLQELANQIVALLK